MGYPLTHYGINEENVSFPLRFMKISSKWKLNA